MKQLKRFLKRKYVIEIIGDDFILNEQQKVKLLEDWLPAFAYFIKYDLNNYIGRFNRLRKLSASPSIYNLVLRYGKQEALKRHKRYAENRTSHFETKTEHWIKQGFSKEESKKQVSIIQTIRGNLASQVVKGSSEYTVRSIAYWLKQGLSEYQAKEKVKDIDRKSVV